MAPSMKKAHLPAEGTRARARSKNALIPLKGTSMRRKPLERHQTLRERILETIRDAILKGILRPGEKVSEPELAERFGISRTPIREAFRQLESEGYLTVIPRKGAVVVDLSERDVEEFYAIKSILEGYAARIAATRMSERDIDKLEMLNRRLSQYARENDARNFYKTHQEFHDLFVAAAGNSKLAELIDQLGLKFSRMRMAALAVPGRMETSVQEHRKIIEALRERNGEKADTMVQETAGLGSRLLRESMAALDRVRKGEAETF